MNEEVLKLRLLELCNGNVAEAARALTWVRSNEKPTVTAPTPRKNGRKNS